MEKREIAILEPRNRFHSLTRTSPIATAMKTRYNCRRVAPKPHFSSEFSSQWPNRGQFGAKIKILSITMWDHLFWAGIISQHQIKLFLVFLKRDGAIFRPRNGCFGLKRLFWGPTLSIFRIPYRGKSFWTSYLIQNLKKGLWNRAFWSYDGDVMGNPKLWKITRKSSK